MPYLQNRAGSVLPGYTGILNNNQSFPLGRSRYLKDLRVTRYLDDSAKVVKYF